ncbi:uncharacterized protein LOC141841900 [Curcuma longa]|uniref:uncharacterized protein LOC141841900 n=1 Tax=Curcuma longa TaxID=136217 RepID=UPI003D9DF53F
MSDIALLVAEDNERRRRRSEGWEKGERGLRREERVRFLASFSATEVAIKTVAMALKEVRRTVEPRSSVGSAAFDGLFSA